MALKVELRPGERMIIGQCVVTNGDQRARLLIEGKAPILREKDIMGPADADTPAKRIYLAIQIMYLEDNVELMRGDYFALVNELVQAAPSTVGLIDQINNEILTGALYKALRKARKLIQYEQDLIENASAGDLGLRPDGEEDV